MDGTGAGSADPTGSAENTATGTSTPGGSPGRPAGPADATGPLPVPAPAPLPADATGPLPAGALFVDPTVDPPVAPPSAGPVDPDPAAYPASNASPTGAMPLVPDAAGPGVPATGPGTTALPTATGAFDVFATGPPDTGAPAVAPDSPTTGSPTAPPPPAELFAADPPGAVGESTGPQAFDVFATEPPSTAPAAAPGDGTAPPTAGFPATGHPTDPSTPPVADLFASEPPDAGTAAGTSGPPTGDLFTPEHAHAAPAGSLPTGHTGADLFTPGPARPPATDTTSTSPSVFSPAVTPADATGPMPLAIPPAEAPAGPASPPVTGALPHTPPAEAEPAVDDAAHPVSASETTVESVPATGAWSFPPAARESEAWSFADGERPSTGTQAGSPPPDAPPPARARARKRAAWPLTLVGVLVAVAAGIALAVSLARTDPDELITAAATDVGGWKGVHYQGTVPAADGGQIRFDLTVTVDGATGTLSRDGGQATAELRRDASGTVLRANRTWWLYHHPTRADDLADTWVAEPLTETKELEPVLQLHPYALASHIRPEQQKAQWTALEERQVDGHDAVVLSDGTRRVVVATAAPHPVLAVDVGPAGALAPVQVSEVAGEEAEAIARAAGEIREAEAPKTLAQRLLERPLVEIQLAPEPLCVTPSCSVTVTVTNSGTIAARGRLEVSADGTLVATHPLDVQPGQVATFTATAPNPQFTTPGATGQILWESRAIDD